MRSFQKTTLLFVTLTALACKKSEPEAIIPVTETATKTEIEKPKPNVSVIAGESIGNISLEMDSQKLEQILGQPDLSDSAMGKSWLTWYSDNSEAISGKTELNIYVTYKDDEMKEKVVRLIRATSPEFQVDSIGAGRKLPDVKSKFPQLKNVGDYAFGKTKDFVSIYDDEAKGVAFEFVKDSCIAVIVHPKDKDVTLDYRMFRPDMTLK
ncbi:hypothetical protein [Flavobacterium sp.]|uniref:hypothetical protein n=1 Tax=Flavobacterium sp. TaxID=239 RepID=UPI0011F9E3D3|nr:hypothetical protein [Flavobacterium sp.]RZJ72914.1 MAG: hypothetical protein EOO49_04585 [Flavobacterium sp.]